MAIQLKNTGDIHTNGLNVLVYGAAGAGKTSLIKTLPNPVALSAEGGYQSAIVTQPISKLKASPICTKPIAG